MEIENQFDFHDSTVEVLNALSADCLISGEADVIIASLDFTRSNPHLWSANTGNKSPIRHIASHGTILSVVDRKGGLFLWDKNGTILWKHLGGVTNGKIIASFFPNDSSILFLVVECSDGSHHIQVATTLIKDGVMRFSIDDQISQLPNPINLVAHDTNADHSLSILNQDHSITVVKRK
jgi:hypothetical protein